MSDLSAFPIARAFPARQGAKVRIETTGGKVIEESLDDIRSASPGLVRERLSKIAAERLGARQAADLGGAIDHMAQGGNDTASLAALAILTRCQIGERVS